MARKTRIRLDRKESGSQQKDISEQLAVYEKRIYDLEQLLDIAKSFSSTLNFSNLLESIAYICMAQMHVLGTEIFVRDLISSDAFILETSKGVDEKLSKISANSPLVYKLLEERHPVTFEYLQSELKDQETLDILGTFNPTLIVPLIQNNHLNGILLLLERIAIDSDTSYTEYEQSQIMSIASLASIAINNASLLEKSSTDMMTHLKLKYFFFNVLTEELDVAFVQNLNIAVLMFDIDFFKKFNDTYGHECGDFVLINVADIIRKCVRSKDVASRYGGEEFTVLLRRTGKEDAMMIGERIRSAIEQHDFVFKDQHLHVTISGGVSVFDIVDNPVSTAKNLVNQADMGLYTSKANGRNRISYFEPDEKIGNDLKKNG